METTTQIQINDLLLPDGIRNRILKSISSYAAAGIDIKIVDQDPIIKSITVVIQQSNLKNGYILNNRELRDRAVEVFADCGYKVKIKPSVFSLDVDKINVRWIEGKMEEFGISRNDLIKQLAIDKSSISLIFSADRQLSKPMRATFFYYFLTYELNRDFRNI